MVCSPSVPAILTPEMPHGSWLSSTTIAWRKDSKCTGCFESGVTHKMSSEKLGDRLSAARLRIMAVTGHALNPCCRHASKPSVERLTAKSRSAEQHPPFYSTWRLFPSKQYAYGWL